ncbi:helix-turn-helix domain-containing protein [Actinomycetota bacterium Odt1-20B]
MTSDAHGRIDTRDRVDTQGRIGILGILGTPWQAVPPLEALAPWVTDIGATSSLDVERGTGRSSFMGHVPDSATKLVFRLPAEGPGYGGDWLVLGPRTRASYFVGGKRLHGCLQLRIRPGAARPLLGVPARDLVGRVVPLAQLPGPAGRALARGLADTEPEPASVLRYLAEELPHRLTPATPAERARDALLRAAVAGLSARAEAGAGAAPGAGAASGPSQARVAEVAHRLAISERQLRNLFTDAVGISPKHHARIDRIRQVLLRAPQGSTPDWARLAGATGYYDQSHMGAEFRALMGVAPTAYVAGRLPAGTPCQASRRNKK